MDRLISLLGLLVLIALAWLVSSHKRVWNWRVIVGGVLLQLLIAVIMLRTPPGEWLFSGVESFFDQLSAWVEEGSGFLFHIYPADGVAAAQAPPRRTLLWTFAFNALPTIIFFSSLMAVLYHVGVMQLVVRGMAWVMQFTLGASGAESLAAAANVFVGHTEAPLVIRPFIARMTRSELNAMMVGGFSTISGGLLAAYHSMGINAGHLVTASVISAPAALVIAKVMQPETETPETRGSVSVSIPRKSANVLEAAAVGASDGMKLAINVAAMLIAFLAMIAMLNSLVGMIGGWFGMTWTIEAGLGYLFAPLAWLMGIPGQDCLKAGELLGLKTVANEFIAYDALGDIEIGDAAGQISQRSQYILTYALSGFSNFAAIGIQIGGIGGLEPERRGDLARLGLRAMFGGLLACCMTACIAGVLI
ncbi:MAG: NupC/NupG family nucleoside CNT transporter [Pirellulaceae bacterium]